MLGDAASADAARTDAGPGIGSVQPMNAPELMGSCGSSADDVYAVGFHGAAAFDRARSDLGAETVTNVTIGLRSFRGAARAAASRPTTAARPANSPTFR